MHHAFMQEAASLDRIDARLKNVSEHDYRRIPPLYWLRRLPAYSPLKLNLSGQRVFCFFSTEGRALNFQEHHNFLSGELGEDWDSAGTDDADHLLLMCKRAPREGGFDGYVIDLPLDLDIVSESRTWDDLRVRIEHKLEKKAAW